MSVLKKILKTLLIILSGLAWFAVIAVIIASMKYGVVTVVSGSMVPTLQIGDSVIAEKAKAKDCEVGDIIVYMSPHLGVNVIHRVTLKDSTVVEKNTGEKKIITYIKTKGDANKEEDGLNITDDDNIRKVVVMPNEHLNKVVRLCNNYISYIAIALLMIVGILIIKGNDRVEKEDEPQRDISDEEEKDEAVDNGDRNCGDVSVDVGDESVDDGSEMESGMEELRTPEVYSRRDAWRYNIDRSANLTKADVIIGASAAVIGLALGFFVVTVVFGKKSHDEE